jgi:hypothetical protein
MKTFRAENGESWVASAEREDTERHHGIWFLIFHRAGDSSERFPVFEVRWQTRATAERTLRTMSDLELQRRLKSAIARHAGGLGPTAVEGETTSGAPAPA